MDAEKRQEGTFIKSSIKTKTLETMFGIPLNSKLIGKQLWEYGFRGIDVCDAVDTAIDLTEAAAAEAIFKEIEKYFADFNGQSDYFIEIPLEGWENIKAKFGVK